MNYFIQIQLAINFIEKNLTNEITLSKVANVSGYSIPHLYRVFKSMTGYNIMEYVRKRRLSEAYRELNLTSQRILSIAVKYNYDSHEAFTRAFNAEYGFSPSSKRKKDEILLFDKLTLLSYLKGEVNMKPKIVSRGLMTIISTKRYVTGSVNEKFRMFSEAKKELVNNLDLIQNRTGNELIATYDLKSDDIFKTHAEMEYIYYIGVEVDKVQDIPHNMYLRKMKPSKYAVFSYNKKTKKLNNQSIDKPIFDYINGVWLPDSGYKLSEDEEGNLLDFELIYPDSDIVEYFISIE
jgi:AraC family transcriptional regulator